MGAPVAFTGAPTSASPGSGADGPESALTPGSARVLSFRGALAIGQRASQAAPLPVYAHLGAGDRVIVHCLITEASGSPTVTVRAQDSSDGENWTEVGGTPLISAFDASSGAEIQRGVVDFPHGRFLRLKLEVSGSSTPTVTASLRASLKNA